MFKILPGVAAWAVMACASADTIYKCTAGGKLSYADHPCANGATELAVPPAPAPDPDTAARLARQRVMAQHLTERDLREERAAEREQQRARRAAASQKLKCDRLRLRHQWAQEDVRRAGAKPHDAAAIKARRHAETLALECPS